MVKLLKLQAELRFRSKAFCKQLVQVVCRNQSADIHFKQALSLRDFMIANIKFTQKLIKNKLKMLQLTSHQIFIAVKS
jgi:hypothetical protein